MSKADLNLIVPGHDGNPIPCNAESGFSDTQAAIATWIALDLLGIDKQWDPQARTFLLAVSSGQGVGPSHPFFSHLATGATAYNGDLAKTLRATKRDYDRHLGDAAAFRTSRIFAQQPDLYTLYKICRWAAAIGQAPHERMREVLANLRYESGIQRDSNAQLISAAVERKHNQLRIANRQRSLAPTLALALKILLADDKKFSTTERNAVHQMMLALEVKPGEVPDLKTHTNKDVQELCAALDPADHAPALIMALEMAILDHTISGKEMSLLETTIACMNLDEKLLAEVRQKVELDTGVSIDLGRSVTIHYGKLSAGQKAG